MILAQACATLLCWGQPTWISMCSQLKVMSIFSNFIYFILYLLICWLIYSVDWVSKTILHWTRIFFWYFLCQFLNVQHISFEIYHPGNSFFLKNYLGIIGASTYFQCRKINVLKCLQDISLDYKKVKSQVCRYTYLI